MLEYNGIHYYTNPQVYEPAEDTFLLADNLQVKRRSNVLEIGTGTGIIAITAARKARMVIATDINPSAIQCATKNIVANKVFNIELRKGDLFDPVKGEKFDLIIFNTPYLPTSEDELTDDDLNAAWYGGSDGREVIERFITDLPHHLNAGGKVQMLQSSLSDIDKTIKKLEELGLEASVTAKEKLFFEETVVITGILKKV
ncbi:MAG TPA: HemK2/MTQ2 family protein methyltransferase [Methanobacterium sp.]